MSKPAAGVPCYTEADMKAAQSTIDALAAEVERLKDESRIVDSVWKALGIENYEQAKPYSISEHVSRLRDLVREAGEIVDDLTIYGAAATVRNEKAWSKAVVDADVWQKKAQA